MNLLSLTASPTSVLLRCPYCSWLLASQVLLVFAAAVIDSSLSLKYVNWGISLTCQCDGIVSDLKNRLGLYTKGYCMNPEQDSENV